MSSLRQSYHSLARPWKEPFVRLATQDGLPFGNANATGDYSDTGLGVTRFWVQPDPNKVLCLQTLNVIISDNGNPAYNEYGNLPNALTNGIRIFLDVGGQLVYGVTLIKTNVDLATVATLDTFTQYANSVRVVVYSKPYHLFSEGFPIHPSSGILRVGLELNDDFSGLLRHHAVIDGYQQLYQV